jgi:hypothetical protein
MFKNVKLWWVSVAALSLLTAVVYVTFFDPSSRNIVQDNVKPEVYTVEGELVSAGPASFNFKTEQLIEPGNGRTPYVGMATKTALVSPSTVFVKVFNRGQSNQSYAQIGFSEVEIGSKVLVYSKDSPTENRSFDVTRVEIDQ